MKEKESLALYYHRWQKGEIRWLFPVVQHLQMADLMTFWLASLPITCVLGEGKNPRRRESIGN
jgi:hypothetical protein